MKINEHFLKSSLFLFFRKNKNKNFNLINHKDYQIKLSVNDIDVNIDNFSNSFEEHFFSLVISESKGLANEYFNEWKKEYLLDNPKAKEIEEIKARLNDFKNDLNDILKIDKDKINL